MIIKQPSLCANVLIASCAFCADRVAAEYESSNADLCCIENDELRPRIIPNGDSTSLSLESHHGTGSQVIKPPASEKSDYQPGLRTVMNMKHQFNWVII